MSDSPLRTLARSIEAAVRPPAFTELVDRARVRRRNRRAGAGLGALAACAAAAVVVVAGVGGLNASGPVRHRQPVSSTSASALPSLPPPRTAKFLLHHPRVLVHRPDATISQVSYASPEDAAVLWDVCSVTVGNGICSQVLTWTSDGWTSSQAKVIAGKVVIYALPNGSTFVWQPGWHSYLISPKGSARRVTVSRTPLHARPSATRVSLPGMGGRRPAGMLDLATSTLYPPLTTRATRCYYDAQWDATGRLWETGAPACGPHQPVTLAWTDDLGQSWSRKRIRHGVSAELLVGTRRVGLIVADLGHPRSDNRLETSGDRGKSWRSVTLRSLGSPDVTGAVTSGRLFLIADAFVFSSDPSWSHFNRVHPPLNAWSLTSADGVLCAYGMPPASIQVSTDDGNTWHALSPRPPR